MNTTTSKRGIQTVRRLRLGSLSLLALAIGSVHADMHGGGHQPGMSFDNAADITRASDLIGRKLENTADKELGKVVDIAIDEKTGRVGYLVVETRKSGFFGRSKGKYVAISMDAIGLDQKSGPALAGTTDDELTIDITDEAFASAPRFADDEWPLQASSLGLLGGAVVTANPTGDGQTIAPPATDADLDADLDSDIDSNTEADAAAMQNASVADSDGTGMDSEAAPHDAIDAATQTAETPVASSETSADHAADSAMTGPVEPAPGSSGAAAAATSAAGIAAAAAAAASGDVDSGTAADVAAEPLPDMTAETGADPGADSHAGASSKTATLADDAPASDAVAAAPGGDDTQAPDSTAAADPEASSAQSETPLAQLGTSSFEALDQDNDGYLSEAELSAGPQSSDLSMSDADIDADGKLNQAEFAAFELSQPEPDTAPDTSAPDAMRSSDMLNRDPLDPAMDSELDPAADVLDDDPRN